jgi:hypothetical protein
MVTIEGALIVGLQQDLLAARVLLTEAREIVRSVQHGLIDSDRIADWCYSVDHDPILAEMLCRKEVPAP